MNELGMVEHVRIVKYDVVKFLLLLYFVERRERNLLKILKCK